MPVVRRPSSSSRLPSTCMRSPTRHAAGSTMPAGSTGERLPSGASSPGSGMVVDAISAPEKTRSPPMRAPASRTRPEAVKPGPVACRPASRLPPMVMPVPSSASPVGEVSAAPARSTLPVTRAPGSRTSASARSRRAYHVPSTTTRSATSACSPPPRSRPPESRSEPPIWASVRSTEPAASKPSSRRRSAATRRLPARSPGMRDPVRASPARSAIRRSGVCANVHSRSSTGTPTRTPCSRSAPVTVARRSRSAGRAPRSGGGEQLHELRGGQVGAREVTLPAGGERVGEIVHAPIVSCAENVARTALSAHEL